MSSLLFTDTFRILEHMHHFHHLHLYFIKLFFFYKLLLLFSSGEIAEFLRKKKKGKNEQNTIKKTTIFNFFYTFCKLLRVLKFAGQKQENRRSLQRRDKMLSLTLCIPSPSPCNKQRVFSQKIYPLRQTRIVCRNSIQVQGHKLSSLSYNPLR